MRGETSHDGAGDAPSLLLGFVGHSLVLRRVSSRSEPRQIRLESSLAEMVNHLDYLTKLSR